MAFANEATLSNSFRRWPQITLILATLLASWLGMQAVHELGHCLGAWLTGGRVAHVELHPLSISRTDLAFNPRPGVVVWAGPLVGVLLPLATWGFAVLFRVPGRYLPRFFAGFCLIANGAYIGLGSFDGVGDCGEMLRHGSSRWHLWAFGLVCIPLGLGLWHRLGHHFGLGTGKGNVACGAVGFSLIACLFLLVLGSIVA